MGSPFVVLFDNVCAQLGQVGAALQARGSIQPFVLEALDQAFDHGDAAVLSNGSESVLDTVAFQELPKDIPGENRSAVSDQGDGNLPSGSL